MEADARQQILEELEQQFESRIRELKRQKSQVEEELDSASERWRSERRHLNAEIDRLEGVIHSKNLSRPGDAPTADPQEIEKIVQQRVQEQLQPQLDQKIRQASAEWAAERDKLIAKNAQLEQSVAEAIERSSNPMRATQSIKDQFEVKLMEANTQRLELEREYLRAKAIWSEEKKELSAEILKLRRLAPAKVIELQDRIAQIQGRKESPEEVRIHELEGQLTEARTDIQKYHEAAMKSGSELSRVTREIRQLQQTVTELRAQDDELVEQMRRDYENKIQELTKQRSQSLEQLDSSRGAVPPPGRATETVDQGTTNIGAVNSEIRRVEKLIEEIVKIVDDPETELSTTVRKNAEKSELEAYLEGLLFSLGRKAQKVYA